MSEPTLMEVEGAWAESGEAWYPRARFTREQARAAYVAETGVRWIEVRVLARHSRYAPDAPEADYFGGDYWIECPPDAPGAFPVWRCE